MSKKYTKKTQRSRRNSPVQFHARIVGKDEGSMQLSLPIAELLAGEVEKFATEAGLLMIKGLIDDEVERRAGPRYQHAAERQVTRWGSEEGSVVFAGRKVPFERPRLRGVNGKEVPLERYRM